MRADANRDDLLTFRWPLCHCNFAKKKRKGCIELEIRLGALNWYKSERMHKLQ